MLEVLAEPGPFLRTNFYVLKNSIVIRPFACDQKMVVYFYPYLCQRVLASVDEIARSGGDLPVGRPRNPLMGQSLSSL